MTLFLPMRWHTPTPKEYPNFYIITQGLYKSFYTKYLILYRERSGGLVKSLQPFFEEILIVNFLYKIPYFV